MASTFKYGDKVEVRDGPDEQWIDGVVLSVAPLKIGLGQSLGATSSPFEFPQVRFPRKDGGKGDGAEDGTDAEIKLEDKIATGAAASGPTWHPRLQKWDTESETDWENGGKRIAYRNLFHSTTSLCLAFCIWTQWGAVANLLIKANKADNSVYTFGYDEVPARKAAIKLLVPISGISGATSRVVHSWAVNICGGRTTTVGSLMCIAFSMYVTAFTLMYQDANLWFLYLCAIMSGIGGGIFSSSVSNVSFYAPHHLQGWFLGVDAGLGNLGVAITARVVPFLSGVSICFTGNGSGVCHTQGGPIGGKFIFNPFFFWGSLGTVNAVLCWRYMNNMPQHAMKPPAKKINNRREPATHWKGKLVEKLVILRTMWQETNFKNFFLLQGGGYLASLLISLLFIVSNPVVNGDPPLIIVRAFLLCPLACVMAMQSLKVMGWFQPHVAERMQLQFDTGILKDRNTFVMCLLYIMTFGSFIGYAKSFGALISTVFGRDPVNYSWLGPMFGSLMRVAGGFVADYIGGAALTQICATVQVLSTFIVAIIVRVAQSSDDPSGQFSWFVFFFIILFTATGLGNASTFKQMATLCADNIEKRGILLGFTAAIAAYGAFIIPTLTGAGVTYGFVDVVFYVLAIYYIFCAALNYWFYYRNDAPFPC